jgi:hypothetical protein
VQQIEAVATHAGVRGGQDDDVGAGQVGLEAHTDGLRNVSRVDVAPQVPSPNERVVLP